MSRNIVKRTQNGPYWLDIQIGGRRHRQSLRTGNLAQARIRAKEIIEQLEARAWQGERRDWRKAVLRWTTHLSGNVKRTTEKRYLVSLRQLAPHFDKLEIAEITKRVIADYVSFRQENGVTHATIRRDLTALSGVLSLCEALEWRKDNPALYWLKRLKEEKFIIDLPAEANVEEMLRRGAPMFRACVRLLAETGMRAQEAVMLEWPQIDLDAREITLLRTKNSRPRVIRISADTAKWLRKLPRTTHSRIVFWHHEGEPYLNFASRFAVLNKGARPEDDLDFRCHDLRHRYAVRELRAGNSIYALSRHLGHSSVKVTEHYLTYINLEEERREDGWHARNSKSS